MTKEIWSVTTGIVHEHICPVVNFDQKSPLHQSEKYMYIYVTLTKYINDKLFTIFDSQENGTIHVSTTLCIYDIAGAM